MHELPLDSGWIELYQQGGLIIKAEEIVAYLKEESRFLLLAGMKSDNRNQRVFSPL